MDTLSSIVPPPTRPPIRRTLAFVLGGMVVALILIGQIMFLVNAARSGAMSGSSASVPTTGSPAYRLGIVLGNALGPSDRGLRRFTITRISPDTENRRRWDVGVRWTINNDFSAGTLGNAGQADAYFMLRDLYTSGLPIALVRLAGTYPMSRGQGHRQETVVMRLSMTRAIAGTIAATGWDNLDAQEVWPLIKRVSVNPQFQPLAPE